MTSRIAKLVLGISLLTAALARADAQKPTFDDDVLPILRQHCQGCHGNDKQRGGLNLAGLPQLKEGGSSGAVAKPGDADGSRLFTLTAHKEEPKMPPKADRIPEAQIEILKKWIDQGMRENAGSKVSMPAKPKNDLTLKVAGKGKPDGPPPMPNAGALPLDPPNRARRPGAIVALAASPWAPVVAVGGAKQILLYHTDTGDLLGVIPFEYGQVYSLKFSRNGKLILAAGGRGGQVGKAVLYDVATGKKITDVGTETDAILSADVSPDQSQIAVGGPSKIVRVYSTSDGSMVREIKKHTDWVTAVEFSPDGVLLASGDRNGGAFVWEANTGREFHTLRGHTAMITDLSWRADSNLLATSSEDTTIQLWEMENGRQIKRWGAHGGGVQSVRFSMDGKIASTGRDRVTKLWDGNGTLQKQFPPFGDLGLRAAVSHDNAKVIAGDWSGSVSMWAVADASLVAALDSNPPARAEQIKLAEAALDQATARMKQTADAVKAAEGNLLKANESLALVQKSINDAKTSGDPIGPAKQAADKAAQTLTSATHASTARQTLATAFTEAAAKVQSEAAKDPKNPELGNAARKAQDLAKQAQSEADAAKKQLQDATSQSQQAQAALVAAQKTAADKAAALNADAQKKLTAVQATVKAAQDALNAAKANADRAAKEAERAKAKVERMKK